MTVSKKKSTEGSKDRKFLCTKTHLYLHCVIVKSPTTQNPNQAPVSVQPSLMPQAHFLCNVRKIDGGDCLRAFKNAFEPVGYSSSCCATMKS